MSTTETKYVGTSVLRREDGPLLTGRGTFVDNIQLPGMVHMIVVRSPYAHARIRSVNLDAARAAEGVVAAFAAADLQDEWKAPMPCAWPVTEDMVNPPHYPLAADEACFQGDGVAVVLATSRALAKDAAELVEVDYDPLPRRGRRLGGGPGRRAARPRRLESNVSYVWKLATDDVDKAFADADVTVKRRYVQPRLIPNAMETRAVVARLEPNGDMTMWSTTQIPHILKALASATIGLNESKARVIAPDVGGGFGSKADVYAEELLVLALARRLGRPVKWAEDRSEGYTSTIHGRDFVTEMEFAATKDGTITGVRANVTAAMGGYLQLITPGIPLLGAWLYSGPYAIPHYSFTCTGVFTNTTPTDAYRGAGRPEATYVIERTIDALAAELGMDVLELRRKNFITEFPAQLASGLTIDSGDYARRARQAARASRPRRPARRAGGQARAGGREAARCRVLHLHRDVRHRSLAHPRGDPFRCRRLGVRHRPRPADRLAPGGDGHLAARPGSRDRVGADRRRPARLRHLGDRGAARRHRHRAVRPRHVREPEPAGRRGGARLRGREGDREGARASWRTRWRSSADDLEFANGLFSVKGSPDRTMHIKEVAWAAFAAHNLPDGMEPYLQATATYDASNFSWPGGAHAAVVEVDTETGDARLVRYVAVDEVGAVVNPMIVDGQVHGGVTQGIATALFEEGVYDEDGNLMTSTLATYLVPSAAELPSFELDRVEAQSPNHPLGAKGVGETGTIASAPAVINAVVDALSHLGVTDVQMPASPERVWRAIQEAKQ